MFANPLPHDFVLFCRYIVWGYLLYALSFLFVSSSRSFKSSLKLLIHDKRRTIPSRFTALVLASAVTFQLAWYAVLPQWPAYFVVISALWVTIYTDLHSMLISRFVSLYLAPVGLLLALLGKLPVSPTESFIAACVSGLFLWSINKIFYWLKKHDGLGQGDIDLLVCLGAWLGVLGAWFAILAGSILGSLYAACCMLVTRKHVPVIPFGPFLAAAALMFIITTPHHGTFARYLIALQ